MRRGPLALVLCCALAAATGAAAQPAAPDASASLPAGDAGVIEVGARLTRVTGDAGRFQRLRDLRSGPTLGRLRVTRDRGTWWFGLEADNAGYRDQRFAAYLEQFGRLGVSFEWDQTPLAYGDGTRTPFHETSAGVFRLDDAVQAAIQGGTSTLFGYADQVERFEVRSRRDVARLRIRYDVTPAMNVRVAFTSTRRHGHQPWAAPFGFNNTTELPLTVNDRTNDLATAGEWSNRRGMVRLAYDASWFSNAVETLVWDNPLRLTDQTVSNAYISGLGSSQGRMALWPDSTAHTVTASGSLALPARSRAFASVSVGAWLQDQSLLPHTINDAIAPIPLPRQTAEAEARITSMHYRLTSRPVRRLWVSGQYRLYDYDNRTPRFAVGDYVRLDGNVSTSATGGSEPFGYTRHFADVDASFTAWRYAALRAGYGEERNRRTFRLLEHTTDRIVRASIDSTGLAWGSVRLQYDRSARTGDGLDEEVFSHIGEQISLRQFDISDRIRHRVSAMVQVVPTDALGVTGSMSVGREHRPDAAFGLQDNDLHAVSVAVDVLPGRALGGTLTYGYERYSTVQQSRQANPGPQFDDPTRDWWTDIREGVHTAGMQVEFAPPESRISARVGVDYVTSRMNHAYRLRPESSLTPPQPLSPVLNRTQVASADVRYALTPRVGLAVGYRYDGYDVDDFALSPRVLDRALIAGFLNLQNTWRPYDAHTGYLRLIYAW